MLQYTNNKEYRQVLRQFFEMKSVVVDNSDDIDEETADELLYDPESVEKKMDDVFAKTKSVNAFVKLYEIAAGHMFSVDLETGLAVLLCYDYFPYYHAFYEKLCEGVIPITNLENTQEYKDLLEKISSKGK
jgi:hypothetical protein